MFLNERVLDKNNKNRSYYVRENDKHHATQLLFIDFVANINAFDMKTRVNLIKLRFQHLFFQKIIDTYLREYDIRVLKFDFKFLK